MTSSDMRKLLARRSALLGILVASVVARLMVIDGQSLWADEFFSLAIATGHSVEHPMSSARPELGDYVEPEEPVSAAYLAHYLEQEDPAAGPSRVIRATRLSDSSPPFYYLLLDYWTRAFGTSDFALRSMSLLAWLVGAPLLARFARILGGRSAVVPTLVLYGLAPMSVYYGTEGRMYALLWPLATAQALATLGLRNPTTWMRWFGWTILAATGLYTHYFYVFPLAACSAWLALQGVRCAWPRLALALVTVGLIVAAWYAEIPALVQQWRVTAGWLSGVPAAREAAFAPFNLLRELITGGQWLWERASWPDDLLTLLFLALIVRVLSTGPRRARLAGLWLAAACVGPLVFDFWMNTHTVRIARYCLSGLPAVLTLAGVALARSRRHVRFACLAAIVALWSPDLATMASSTSRALEPFGEVASALDALVDAEGLVIVDSVPSSAAGLSRYLSGDVQILPWTETLRTAPGIESLERAVGKRSSAAFVSIHSASQRSRARDWFEGEFPSRRLWTDTFGYCQIELGHRARDWAGGVRK